MESPLQVVNGIGDGITNAANSLGTSLTGVVSQVNSGITSALDKPPILGKYGPHKAIDRLVRGTLGAINHFGSGAVGSVQDQGHAFVSTLGTPFDQVSSMTKK